MVISGLHEDGAGYSALDVTQPSPVEPPTGQQPPAPPAPSRFVPRDDYEHTGVNPFEPPALVVPSCTGAEADGDGIVDPLAVNSPCGPVPYPAPLWEFDDSILESGIRYQLDEEGRVDDAVAPVGNSSPDLGAS